MSINTVTGPIDKTQLGYTLPHEHLLIDLRNQYREPPDPESRERGREPVARPYQPILNDDPYALRDNLLIDDIEVQLQELAAFRAAGGRSIIECTCCGIRRDVRGLRELSQRSGVQVVAGCGWYTHDTHPDQLTRHGADALAELLCAEFSDGIDGSGIRPGFIGEIGLSHPVHAGERVVLRAAARAHHRTNAAVYVHTYPWGTDGCVALDLLEEEGVPLNKVVICHVDVQPDLGYIRSLLARGAMVEFDNFGKAFTLESVQDNAFAAGGFITDEQRVSLLHTLCADNYAEQLLMSTDICLKCMLCHYGGAGYAHVPRTIAPALQQAGVAADAVHQMSVVNPARLLDM